MHISPWYNQRTLRFRFFNLFLLADDTAVSVGIDKGVSILQNQG